MCVLNVNLVSTTIKKQKISQSQTPICTLYMKQILKLKYVDSVKIDG